VNDDEHSLFVAMRIGYCYVAYNVWNKTPESMFLDYTTGLPVGKIKL